MRKEGQQRRGKETNLENIPLKCQRADVFICQEICKCECKYSQKRVTPFMSKVAKSSFILFFVGKLLSKTFSSDSHFR